MKFTSAVVKWLEVFSLFLLVTDFASHMEGWVWRVRHDFSKGKMLAFRGLLPFALKIPGACQEEIDRKLEGIRTEYDCFWIRRSIQRMGRKAKALGRLALYETERESGAWDGRLGVLQPYPRWTGSA